MLIDVPEWRRDILVEHLEELEALLNRRARATRSPAADALALRRIDARLDAHADALALAGPHGWPLLIPALAQDPTPTLVEAATLALASAGAAEAETRLLAALAAAPPPGRAAMCRALQLRASPDLRRALPIDPGAPPALAGVGCLVLAAHGDPLPAGRHWPLVADGDPAVRALAWQVEARLGAGRPGDQQRLGASDYQAALADADPEVRRGALEAAARTGQPWLLDHLRAAARAPSAAALPEQLLFAALSPPADSAAALALGAAPALGWERFRVLALLGRAAAVEELLRAMRQGPAVEAALAGAAFFRITGVDVERAERLPLLPPGADPDELADEIKACDVDKAELAWRQLAPRLSAPGRWAYGVEVEGVAGDALPLAADLEIRWATSLRRAHATRTPVTLDHERFPFS